MLHTQNQHTKVQYLFNKGGLGMMKHIFWHLGLVLVMKTTELGIHSTNCLQQPVHLCHQWRMVIHIQSFCSPQTGIKDKISQYLKFSHEIMQQIVFIILSRM